MNEKKKHSDMWDGFLHGAHNFPFLGLLENTKYAYLSTTVTKKNKLKVMLCKQ